MSRSFEMLAGVLGILKAGGTCVPLDLTFPQERLAFMAGETGLRTILRKATDQPARLLGRETYVAGGTCRRNHALSDRSAFSRGFWRPSRLT